MMENDFAVIVGLQTYPGLDDPAKGRPPLSGPENDAKDFKEWVASAEGGDVPEQNISLILSSLFEPVEIENLLQAKPAESEIAGPFEKLRRMSLKNVSEGRGTRVGRRLYIYMAGHGIAPTQYGNKLEKECALLMSNVDPTNMTAPRYNIPGLYTATWFCENECFDEIFLFMDCCRDTTMVASPNWFLPIKGNADNAKRFYAFATRWSRRSREAEFKGKMQGIFTKTLLLALNGGSAIPDPSNPSQGIITGQSLSDYLFSNMRGLISDEFMNDPQVQQPDIDYFPKWNPADIVIKHSPILKYPVEVQAKVSGSTGHFKIWDGHFSVAGEGVFDTGNQTVEVLLPRGKFLLEGTFNGVDASLPFDVTGSEDVGEKIVLSI